MRATVIGIIHAAAEIRATSRDIRNDRICRLRHSKA